MIHDYKERVSICSVREGLWRYLWEMESGQKCED